MKIVVHNQQRAVKIDLRPLQKLARFARDEICGTWLRPASPLTELELIEVTVVTDAIIGEIHLIYFDDSSPTDVISFDHGEIVISADTARANALRFRTTADDEAALYLVHGLLHLAGYDDEAPADAARMRRIQKKVLATCLAKIDG